MKPLIRQLTESGLAHDLRLCDKELKALKRFLVIASSIYVALLVLSLLAMQFVGERNWIFGIVLYALPSYWLLPMVALLPLCLMFCPRACWLHTLALMFVTVVFMQLRWHYAASPNDPAFTIMSNNIGNRTVESLFPITKRVKPDLIALQDASVEQGKALISQMGGMHLAHEAEFVLASRFKILASGVVEGLLYDGRPIVAWFQVDCAGRPLIIYDVHLPTPRPDFLKLRGHGFLAGLFLGGGIYSQPVRKAYCESLSRRVRLAEQLAQKLAREDRAFLAVGDFNAPSQGYVRRLFSSELTDAFSVKGRGFGFTFPGVSRNPFSCFGPWLRLDYIFVDQHIVPTDCWVEPRQPAQHRALIGGFQFKGGLMHRRTAD